MAHATCVVCLISSVSGRCKNPLKGQALVAGTKQNLSNLLFLDIYGDNLFYLLSFPKVSKVNTTSATVAVATIVMKKLC